MYNKERCKTTEQTKQTKFKRLAGGVSNQGEMQINQILLIK